MKPSQLQELLRLITRTVIKEYSSMTTSVGQTDDDSSASGTAGDPNGPPVDAMTLAQKNKAARDAETARRQQLKQKEIAKKSELDKQKFYKSNLDQSRRVDVKNLERDIQRLKGASAGPAIT